jgi:isoaspartyl peptidase/L-asparaginase-like protein (Ntn-hydrolase superfamily)
MAEPIVVATWPFGRTAVQIASKLLAAGKPPLEAALAGAQAVEDDPKVHSVGYSGIGNSIGTVSLDACVMDGKTLDCGSVAAVENIRHVAALAKKVYEKTPHVMLVGKGAEWFALQNGFELETLLTPESVAEWEKNRPKKKEPKGHDTVTVLANDGQGHLGGVCTTSGLSYKLPGRVGDSPLIGSGLYVDDEAGAAGATGVGEEIIRIGGALFMVEQMRAGKSPQQVTEAAVLRAIAAAVRRGQHPAKVAFLALSPKGEFGAACTQGTNFQFAVGRGENVELLKAKEM